MTVSIKGISYVHLLVEDWPMALAFYGELLGLPIEQQIDEEQWVSFDLAGGRLVVTGGGVASDRAKGADRNAFVPNLECEDIEQTVADLEGRGVPFIVPLSTNPDGYKLATLVDPEGNRMQLFEWGAPDAE